MILNLVEKDIGDLKSPAEKEHDNHNPGNGQCCKHEG